MNKGILVKSILVLIETNGLEDDVRFALNEKAAQRERLPFELHYSDGYRSWFFEKNKVADAFYFGGYLVSIFDTKAVGYYDEAKRRASAVKIGGKCCQVIPQDLCITLQENICEINSMLHKIGGDGLRGEVWVDSGNNNFCFNFSNGKTISRNGNTCELMTRPVIAL